MTPCMLVKDLKKELEYLFANTSDDISDHQGTCIHIYEQMLPAIISNQEGKSRYPYIVVELASGEVLKSESPYAVHVNFKIGVSKNLSNVEDYEMAFHIIHIIYQRFAKDNTLNSMYCAENAFKWAIIEDRTKEPDFFAKIEMIFDIPKIEKENAFV